MDRVEDRRRRRHQGRLADALGAPGPERLGVLDQVDRDRRHVADGRDQVVVQVVGAAVDVFLHQRHADALGDAAVHLAFDQGRVDRPADVVRRVDVQQRHRAELDIDLELGDLRREAVGRVRHALAVGVERHGRRVEVAARRERGRRRRRRRPVAQVEPRRRARRRRGRRGRGRRARARPRRRRRRPGRAARAAAGAAPRPAARAALPETKVWREADDLPASAVQVGVAHHLAHAGQRQADRVGEHLRHDRRGALADLLRPVVEEEMGAVPGVAAQRAAHRRRIGDHRVADAVPHAGDAGTAAKRPSGRCGLGVERVRRCARRRPGRPQRIEAGAQADARLEPLPGRRAVAGAQGVAMAKLERIDAALRGELVDQQLAEQRRLRHAEAAEGAGDAVVRQHGAGQGAHVRHAVRAAGVDRHPVGDRRSPGRIGAGVEVAAEIEGAERAVGAAGRGRGHLRRMPLGAGLHRLRPLVDQAHRPAELPGGDREQRLHRDVELAAEAAADRRGHDVHLLGRDRQHVGDLVAVHVGRLGAGEDADAARGAPPAPPARSSSAQPASGSM